MRTHIAYINYTKKLRIFNILTLFCVVYLGRPAKRSAAGRWVEISFRVWDPQRSYPLLPKTIKSLLRVTSGVPLRTVTTRGICVERMHRAISCEQECIFMLLSYS